MEDNHKKQQKFLLFFSFAAILLPICQSFNYTEALSKSLLYFESQRSGRLPYNQRVTWRHHSALTDGLEQGVSVFILRRRLYCRLY